MRSLRRLIRGVARGLTAASQRPERGRSLPSAETASNGLSAVEAFWSRHTVNSRPFNSAAESSVYLEWRFAQYPMYRELMELWGNHDNELLVDYGCGPGDDVVGFLLYGSAREVVACDVSELALQLARSRVALHGIDNARVRFVRTSDAHPSIELPDDSVDFVHCGGVLHHTSDPAAILREFHRVLKPGGRANVMVYNRDSVWYHLFTAYVRMILEDAFEGFSVEEAFGRNTDGPECPISRCYRPMDFLALSQGAGFDGEFVGGYLSLTELDSLRDHGATARGAERLGAEHRAFLRELETDDAGLPTYRGKHAGIGGTYRLKKR